jgi:aspartokinase-like uncharacterized kinase
MSAVVIKVGGSLLEWRDLPARLSEYLRGRADRQIVLIAGGGGAANWIRALDRAVGLGDTQAHALAVRSMDLTAHVLAARVKGLAVATDVRGIEAIRSLGLVPVLSPARALDDDDRGPDPLPRSWQVTSDSIAARLATRLGAPELVLLKSAAPPPAANRLAAVEAGLVDAYFVRAAELLARVIYRNLRDPGGIDVLLARLPETR